MPRVLVVIPTYNRAEYLADALESVLAQTYQDFHIVVVDDGSTDDTPAVLRRYEDRITCIRQENQGASIARNRGVTACDSDFIALQDSDDLWLPTLLAKQVDVMDHHPEVGMVCADSMTFIGAPPAVESDCSATVSIAIEDAYAKLFRGFAIALPSVLIRRDVYQEVGGFDPELRISYDWDLWLKICERYPIGRICETLLMIRRHEGNTSWQDALTSARVILAEHPPQPARIQDPDEAIHAVLARFCLLALVEAATTDGGIDQGSVKEWFEHREGSRETDESWAPLFAHAVVDKLARLPRDEHSARHATSKLLRRLFTSRHSRNTAFALLHQSLAWRYADVDRSSAAMFAWSAIARSPRLAADKGLLRLALGLGRR